MTKREAFADARATYPAHEPTRAAGFILSGDGKGVIVAGHDKPVTVVLHNKTDLWRLMTMCRIALEARG